MTQPEPISTLVERKLQGTFAQRDEADKARVLLASYGTESWHREQNRVRLAVLKLADGDLDELRTALKIAEKDYRDALASAEFPRQMQSLASEPVAQTVLDSDRKQYLDWLNSSNA